MKLKLDKSAQDRLLIVMGVESVKEQTERNVAIRALNHTVSVRVLLETAMRMHAEAEPGTPGEGLVRSITMLKLLLKADIISVREANVIVKGIAPEGAEPIRFSSPRKGRKHHQ